MTEFEKSIAGNIDRIPSSLVFQCYSGCNFTCKFCAYQETVSQNLKYSMDFTLFCKIVDEFYELGKLGSVGLGLQCEALLDQRLDDRIRYIKQKSPETQVSLTTNVSLLTPERFKQLCAAGVDSLCLSLDALSEKSFKNICSSTFPFDKVISNIEYITDNCPQNLYVSISSMVIKESLSEFLLTGHPVLEKAKKAGISFGLGPVSNHTGSLANYEEILVLSELQGSKLKSFCPDIWEAVYILADGDVVGCCSDWNRKFVLGNLVDSSFKDIWNKEEVKQRRHDMLNSDYRNLKTCANCSQAWNIIENCKSKTDSKKQSLN